VLGEEFFGEPRALVGPAQARELTEEVECDFTASSLGTQ
jgi:hypothetical protein